MNKEEKTNLIRENIVMDNRWAVDFYYPAIKKDGRVDNNHFDAKLANDL